MHVDLKPYHEGPKGVVRPAYLRGLVTPDGTFYALGRDFDTVGGFFYIVDDKEKCDKKRVYKGDVFLTL